MDYCVTFRHTDTVCMDKIRITGRDHQRTFVQVCTETIQNFLYYLFKKYR